MSLYLYFYFIASRIWSTVHYGCIKGGIIRTLNDVSTTRECQTKCDGEANFACQSISYDYVRDICELSFLNSTSPSYQQPCRKVSSLHWDYSEVIPKPG